MADSSGNTTDGVSKPPRPNILLITCDQYRFPRFSYGENGGFYQDLKEVLGFQEIGADNQYAQYFPGIMKLRQNAVVLRNHTIAASACTPSRAVIYTGQYGTRTGVTQTDGLFKNGDASNFPWLAADGIPTLGTWMREAGYTTHYFGKWHVSNPPEHSLRRYGFDNWETSYPEPHGSQSNNLGLYRDLGFTDSACAFIRRQGLALNYDRVYADKLADDPNASAPDTGKIPPWFAVASFTNPHDIATYPGVISQGLPKPDNSGTQSAFGPLTVPLEGQTTPPPAAGTMMVPLNRQGFPQECANPSPTQDESLAGKPSCQHDYAYKMGLALASKLGFNVMGALPGSDPSRQTDIGIDLTLKSCIPFQLSDDPSGNCKTFLQLYAWLHYVVDPHIDAVLTALEESGQAENTIVLFLADHGEYGAAHGMMIEKWHTAYAEALHVPVVVSHRPFNEMGAGPIQCDALTSHVDILPTVLGLAGVGPLERETIAKNLRKSRPVPDLPGVDLAPLIRGEWRPHEIVERDGSRRKGVLFITDDEITAPLPPQADDFSQRSYGEFELYCATVDAVREGYKGKGPVDIAPGPVRQPNHVRCGRTMDYKLSRYFDPSGRRPQEWEMYDLRNDANETTNLVQVNGSPPKAVDPALQPTVDELAELLLQLEAKYLS